MPLHSGVFTDTPIDRSEIQQTVLNIERKSRSNPFSWRGQFSPQFVQALLDRYASTDCVILDPFLGSGTVLLEAGNAGLSAFGTEINPAAISLARIYQFVNVPFEVRRDSIKRLDSSLSRILPNTETLLPNHKHRFDQDSLKSELVELEASITDPLAKTLMRTLIVTLDFYIPISSLNKPVKQWETLVRFVLNLPFSGRTIRVYHSDARSIPQVDSFADLVVTSPPYINVFNYHQQYRASVESLRWNLLDVARSEVGANRKHRSNRFLTVIQYCLDIAQALEELLRVCKHNARIIFVVGRQSMVRGVPFYNGEIVAELATRVLGFRLILRQERVFLNRFGKEIYEDILHFMPSADITNGSILKRAREIAQDVLVTARRSAPSKVKSDLEAALIGIGKVSPSPMYMRPQNKNLQLEWTCQC